MVVTDNNTEVHGTKIMEVKFKEKKSLLALVRLERELGMALGRKVDLLTEAAISPYLHDRIMKDLQVIYEAG